MNINRVNCQSHSPYLEVSEPEFVKMAGRKNVWHYANFVALLAYELEKCPKNDSISFYFIMGE